GSGRLAVGLGAVVSAGLAAGLLRLAGGLALGEGSGLALAGAGGLVELAAEALVLGLQVAEASFKGLAAGTRDGLHTSIIGRAPAAAALPQLWNRDQLELDALIKYKWEYEKIGLTTTENLNKLGADGWELVAVDRGDAYFKRAK